MSAERSPGARAALVRAQRTALTVFLSIFVGSWLIVGALLAPAAGGWATIGAAALLLTVVPLARALPKPRQQPLSGQGDPAVRLPPDVVRAVAAHSQRARRTRGSDRRTPLRRRRPRRSRRDRGDRDRVHAVRAASATPGREGSSSPRSPSRFRRFPKRSTASASRRSVTRTSGRTRPARTSHAIASAVRDAEPDLIAVVGDLIDDFAPDVSIYAAGARRSRGTARRLHRARQSRGVRGVERGAAATARALANGAGEREPRSRAQRRAARDRRHGRSCRRSHRGTRRAGAGHRGDARATFRAGVFTIVLAHNPALWPPLATAGVPLTLSGHTHWGQLSVNRAGWSLANVFLELAMGAYRARRRRCCT